MRYPQSLACAQFVLEFSKHWHRILLVLAIAVAMSAAHLSLMTTAVTAFAFEHPHVVVSEVGHCSDADCREGGIHHLECCSSGSCACLLGGALAQAVQLRTAPGNLVHDYTATGRPGEGIDRPPKATRVSRNSL